jgi:hypothetical protein
MKTILIILFFFVAAWSFRANKNGGNKNSSIRAIDTINYKTQLQPVFQKNCSPCHFPGGKLYEKLPFDNGATIIDHLAGVLRRIKNEEDIKLIKQYAAQKNLTR